MYPLLSEKIMYLEHFGLQRQPFKITPDPSMFCSSGGRGEILEALIYAINAGEGIVKVVGEVGSGKTMLCRILEERLPQSVDIVYLANPRLSPDEILYAIAFELKLPVTSQTGRLPLMQHLQSYLLEQHGAGKSVVVFIEEAQGMPIATLEEIRLLSNLETRHHKLLQIILFGQPELDTNLRKRHIRQLRDRITHSFYLAPLNTAEVSEYIQCRLQGAGFSGVELFDRRAIKMITSASCGLIRRINILADKAMLAAYATSAVGLPSGDLRAVVNVKHVRAATGDCDFGNGIRPWRQVAYGLSMMVVAIVAVMAWRNPFPLSKLFQPVLEDNVMVSESMALNSSVRPIAESAIEPGSSIVEVHALPAPPVPEQHSSQTAEVLSEDTVQAKVNSDDMAGAASHQAAETSVKSLLDLRREAAARWLQGVDPEKYTIQILATSLGDEKYLERFLRRFSTEIELDRSYVWLVGDGEKEHWVVLYGEFEMGKYAREAIEKLPPELRRAQPFVRNLTDLTGGLLAEGE